MLLEYICDIYGNYQWHLPWSQLATKVGLYTPIQIIAQSWQPVGKCMERFQCYSLIAYICRWCFMIAPTTTPILNGYIFLSTKYFKLHFTTQWATVTRGTAHRFSFQILYAWHCSCDLDEHTTCILRCKSRMRAMIFAFVYENVFHVKMK